MKKCATFLAVFIISFVIVYIALCYSPWFALKLSAPLMEYFIASVKKLWYIKAAIGAALGAVAGTFITYKIK